MRRNAVTLLTSLFLVSMLGGCSLFGGKKKAATEEDFGSTAELAMPAETYPPSPYADGYTTGGTIGSRYHTVQKKDTLYALARQYYNDQSRWKDIYEANRTEIGDPNKIRVGQRLLIP